MSMRIIRRASDEPVAKSSRDDQYMASPASQGTTLSSSLGTGAQGSQPSNGRPSVETTIDRGWQFDYSQHKSKCSTDAEAFLEDRLRMLAKSREPGDTDSSTRHAAIERLQTLLADMFPPPSDLKLVPYGSFLSSCYSHGSDLDLALSGRLAVETPGLSAPFGASQPLEALESQEWRWLLLRLADQLEERGVTRGSVTRITEARVPIIKFVESVSGIECDICVTTRGCDFKGAVMRLLHGLQPALAPLIRLVKLWAKHHDINSAHCGTLNSWSLALMALWSMQTHPGGQLLPPLWRLFHEEEPAGRVGAGRPLRDKSLQLDLMLQVAKIRCSEDAGALLPSGSPPGQGELLLWFLSAFSSITGQWRDNPAHRNWRVSPWRGRGYSARFPKSYLAAVEEPFDCSDNTARSVGIKERHENTLSYIAWVFGHSVHLLRNVVTVADAARTLVWLFGPEAVPLVGLERLQIPPGTLPPDLARRLLEGGRRGPPGGPDGAGERGTNTGSPAREATEDELHSGRVAFRALLDALRAGSPLTSLDDWRGYLNAQPNRHAARPPHTWHRAPPPARPLPPPPPPAPPPHHLSRPLPGRYPDPVLAALLPRGPPAGPPHSPAPPPGLNGGPPSYYGFPYTSGAAGTAHQEISLSSLLEQANQALFLEEQQQGGNQLGSLGGGMAVGLGPPGFPAAPGGDADARQLAAALRGGVGPVGARGSGDGGGAGGEGVGSSADRAGHEAQRAGAVGVAETARAVAAAALSRLWLSFGEGGPGGDVNGQGSRGRPPPHPLHPPGLFTSGSAPAPTQPPRPPGLMQIANAAAAAANGGGGGGGSILNGFRAPPPPSPGPHLHPQHHHQAVAQLPPNGHQQLVGVPLVADPYSPPGGLAGDSSELEDLLRLLNEGGGGQQGGRGAGHGAGANPQHSLGGKDEQQQREQQHHHHSLNPYINFLSGGPTPQDSQQQQQQQQQHVNGRPPPLPPAAATATNSTSHQRTGDSDKSTNNLNGTTATPATPAPIGGGGGVSSAGFPSALFASLAAAGSLPPGLRLQDFMMPPEDDTPLAEKLNKILEGFKTRGGGGGGRGGPAEQGHQLKHQQQQQGGGGGSGLPNWALHETHPPFSLFPPQHQHQAPQMNHLLMPSSISTPSTGMTTSNSPIAAAAGGARAPLFVRGAVGAGGGAGSAPRGPPPGFGLGLTLTHPVGGGKGERVRAAARGAVRAGGGGGPPPGLAQPPAGGEGVSGEGVGGVGPPGVWVPYGSGTYGPLPQ